MFEKCISTCLDYYGLDPCHYFSSPGLSWDAMLKMTRIKLGLIKDIVKQITNSWSVIIVVKKVDTLLILMRIICMVGQLVSIYHIVNLNG